MMYISEFVCGLIVGVLATIVAVVLWSISLAKKGKAGDYGMDKR